MPAVAMRREDGDRPRSRRLAPAPRGEVAVLGEEDAQGEGGGLRAQGGPRALAVAARWQCGGGGVVGGGELQNLAACRRPRSNAKIWLSPRLLYVFIGEHSWGRPPSAPTNRFLGSSEGVTRP